MSLTKEDIEKFKKLYKEQYDEELNDFVAYEAANHLVNMIRAVYKPIPKADEDLYNKLEKEHEAVPEDKKIDFVKHLVEDAKLTEFKNEIGEKKYWELVRMANGMILQGNQVNLKKNFLKENYPQLLAWLTDLEIIGYLYSAKRMVGFRTTKDIKNFLVKEKDEIFWRIYTNDDKFIGYTSLCSFQGKEQCEFNIFILDKNYWGKSIGLEVTRLILGYAFNRLEMKKVVLETSEFHQGAIKLYEKAGFRKVKVVPNDRTVFHNGEWVLSGSLMMEIVKKEMQDKDVIDLYAKLEDLGIKIWIDGGWAVDALLGEQTRSHEDLDVAVERKNLTKLREYLESKGYNEIKRDEDKMWDLVMGDDKGHELDIHAFSLDDKGSVIAEEYWDGYSSNSLTGSGIIDGQTVRCVSPEQLVKTHDGTKRKLKDSDHEDMDALCSKFGIKL
ncbi:MAG: GNAT family N-acetyltransferase [Candidatus Moranbacteria bacterium]|nr:GNAT family N-acetyltransferase [Candidatus Moranbacteria bacterium]